MTRMRIPVAAVAAAVLLVGGCAGQAEQVVAGDQAGAGAAADGDVAPDGDAVVLRVWREGGFVPQERIVGSVPELSLYADGRMITTGPVPAVHPGLALPNLLVQQLDEAATAKLLDDALAAGVRTGADFGSPNVADAATTRIDVVRDGVASTVRVPALREAPADDPLLTADQRAARAKLSAFLDRLRETTVVTPDQKPYGAQTVAALAQTYVKAGDVPEQPAAIAWPGPPLPGENLNPGVGIGCVTASGAERDAILAAAKTARQNTPWSSGAEDYTVTFRPLLPDETGCADLRASR